MNIKSFEKRVETEAAAKNSCWDLVSKTNKGFALTATQVNLDFR